MIIPTVRFNEYTKKFAFADLAKANLLKREVTPSYHRRSLVRIKKLELLSATPRATLTHLSCSPIGELVQLVHTSACVHRDMKHAGSLENTKDA